jgi:hypothetical protein
MTGRALASIEGLTESFGATRSLDDVDLTIHSVRCSRCPDCRARVVQIPIS